MAKQNEARALGAILKVLKENGVAEYRRDPDGAVSVRFRDTSLQELNADPAALEPEGNALNLPPDLFNPMDALKRINAKAQQRQ